MISKSSNKFPASWETPHLAEIYSIVGGGTPSTKESKYWIEETQGTAWITSADIQEQGKIIVRKHVSELGIQNSTTNKVSEKTLLVVTRVGLGKVALTNSSICFSQDIHALIQDAKLVVPKYSLFFLQYHMNFLKFDSRGTTIPGITNSQLKTVVFPFAPFNEQHRIVAKIEELFSEIDKGVESLKTAKAQLQVYRQALLKHAFEGKLTAQWRADNPDKVVPAAQLLAQIQQAREERYQQQLADWKTAVEKWELGGKEGKKPSKPKRTPIKLETTQKFIENKKIPEKWAWSTLEDLLEYVTSGSRGWAEYYSQSGSIFVRAQNLKHDRVNLEDVAYVDLPGSVEGTRSKLKHNDILITITGANVTKTGIVEKRLSDAYISQHVALCRLANSDWSEYVYFYLLSEIGGRKQLNDCAYGAGKPGLNLENIKSVTIPFCSHAEQLAIVSEIKSQFSVLENMTADIENELQTADALKQSILKKAFSGQLVSQDPTDEPASQLLARIQAEKAERETDRTASQKNRKPRKTKTAS